MTSTFCRDLLSLLSDLQTTSSCPFHSAPTMEKGNCTIVFLSLAVILDIVGCILFFLGVFAPLSFWDFFVLSGPLLIFLSLVFWIFWYMGSLTVSEEELNLLKPDIL
ncbi:Transmembrane protein 238 [Channa argus]|uniref:Transmembrane protein 238 n=1 Tax=Channa argus TaxID=215402 RepID=A0A6G1QCA3_CHAAH|nr:Transmembrane protein 238 [Channa argus]